MHSFDLLFGCIINIFGDDLILPIPAKHAPTQCWTLDRYGAEGFLNYSPVAKLLWIDDQDPPHHLVGQPPNLDCPLVLSWLILARILTKAASHVTQ